MNGLELAKAPVRRLMRNAGAEIASDNSVEFLMEKLQDLAKEFTEAGLKITKQSNRKKLTKADLKAALDIKGI